SSRESRVICDLEHLMYPPGFSRWYYKRQLPEARRNLSTSRPIPMCGLDTAGSGKVLRWSTKSVTARQSLDSADVRAGVRIRHEFPKRIARNRVTRAPTSRRGGRKLAPSGHIPLTIRSDSCEAVTTGSCGCARA